MSETQEVLRAPESIIGLFDGLRVLSLDIETTGLKDDDEIIELGVIEFVNGVETRRGSTLFGGKPCPEEVIRRHGITDDQRAGKLTFAQKSEHVYEYFQKAILLGHNIVKFDLPFIDRVLKANGFFLGKKKGYIWAIDTLLLSRQYLGASSNKLENLCKMYKLEHGGHRGLGDAINSWQILCIILEKLKCQNIKGVLKKVSL